MKKLALTAVTLACALLVSQAAFAANYSCGLMGSGSFMTDGATYSGTFMYGMSGTWTIDVDDSLWPAAADSNARWTYIWDTFFADNYDDTQGAEAWWGTFDLLTLGSIPTFQFVTTSPGGTVGGACTFKIMIRDWSGDGTLSQSEKHRDSQIVFTMSIDPNQGTGTAFENWCGDGSFSSGNFRFVNPPQVNTIQIVGMLRTNECPSPVEDTTWGTIKALYN